MNIRQRPATIITLTITLTVLLLGVFIPAAWASSTGRCGGTGGKNQKTLTCPSGQYVVGLQAKGDSYVDLVGIACAPIGADRKRGTVGAFMSAGPGGGRYGGSGICQGNRAVTAIRGKSGVYYDKIGDVVCNPRLATGRFDRGDHASAGVNAGGGGGGVCRMDCPSGEALYSVTVKYGSWVDSVSGQCRP